MSLWVSVILRDFSFKGSIRRMNAGLSISVFGNCLCLWFQKAFIDLSLFLNFIYLKLRCNFCLIIVLEKILDYLYICWSSNVNVLSQESRAKIDFSFKHIQVLIPSFCEVNLGIIPFICFVCKFFKVIWLEVSFTPLLKSYRCFLIGKEQVVSSLLLSFKAVFDSFWKEMSQIVIWHDFDMRNFR